MPVSTLRDKTWLGVVIRVQIVSKNSAALGRWCCDNSAGIGNAATHLIAGLAVTQLAIALISRIQNHILIPRTLSLRIFLSPNRQHLPQRSRAATTCLTCVSFPTLPSSPQPWQFPFSHRQARHAARLRYPCSALSMRPLGVCEVGCVRVLICERGVRRALSCITDDQADKWGASKITRGKLKGR